MPAPASCPHNLSEHMLNTHGCGCFLEQPGDTISYQGRGLIPIYDSWWTNGIVLVGALDIFDYAIGVTTGALSNPKAEGNGRPSYVGRVGIEPLLGVSAGVSGFWGPYLSPEAADGNLVRVPPPSDGEVYDFGQAAVGQTSTCCSALSPSSPRGCTRCGRCPTSFQTSACGLGSWRPATTCCRNCTLLPDTIT